MGFPLSRTVSAATAAYGVFALVKPAHLADALQVQGPARVGYETLARSYGARDIAVSAAALVGPPSVVKAAMGLRIAMDVADCATLVLASDDESVRTKVASATLGWGAVNVVALAIDLARD